MKKQQKRAFVTGVNGMDGSHISDLLISKGYKVYGMIRRVTNRNYQNIQHLMQNENFELLQGDLSDQNSILRCLTISNPNEIYHLGAQSFVAESFKTPENTANITGLGTLRVLEAMREFGNKQIRMYNAASSQMYGKMVQSPANEYTPFYPRSPYGVSKVFSYYMTKNYRQAYDMYCCNGILFNHESHRRGKQFVTRKITTGIKDIVNGKLQFIELGNLDARRDWGFAPKYCFPAGTKILVNNELGYHKLKSINIQQVKVGDSVLSWDGEKKCLDKVTKTFVNKSNELLEIKFSNGNKIICTKQHPFGVNVNGTIQWIEAKDLRTEMECVQYNHYSTNMRIKNLLNIGKNNEQRLGKDKSVQVSNKLSKARKGKSYDDICHGDALKAQQWKKKVSQASVAMWQNFDVQVKTLLLKQLINNAHKDNHSGWTSPRKGLTFDEYFGLETSNQIKNKISNSNRGRKSKYLGKRIEQYMTTEKCNLLRQKLSISSKRMWDNTSSSQRIQRLMKTIFSGSNLPNKSQIVVQGIIKEVSGDKFVYNGDGKYQRQNQLYFDGMIPDFVSIDNSKKVIQFFGQFWHRGGVEQQNVRKQRLNDLGYDCLVLWGRDLNKGNIESTKQKIKNFIYNPNTQVVNIVSIQNITLQDEIDVYNFQTENYHNYFAYGILVHNCEAMHLMLQQPSADDYVVATEESHSIKQFLDIAFKYVGLDHWQKYVHINPIYFRPAQVDVLVGNASKIRSIGWQYDITFKELVENMMKKELENI